MELPQTNADERRRSSRSSTKSTVSTYRQQNIVTMLVHLRPCQHMYHIACFAYACRTAAVCLADCNTNLPDEWRKQTGKFVAYVEKQLSGSELATCNLWCSS